MEIQVLPLEVEPPLQEYKPERAPEPERPLESELKEVLSTIQENDVPKKARISRAKAKSADCSEVKSKAKPRSKAAAQGPEKEVSLQETKVLEEAPEPEDPESTARATAEALAAELQELDAREQKQQRLEEKKAKSRGRPPGVRNKPKEPQIVERIVYQKPPPLSALDVRALLRETLRKQELEAREQKRAHYSRLIRGNR